MPEGAAPRALDPTSNPQPSITVGKRWAGIRSSSVWVPTPPGAASHTSACPARARLPGHRAVLSTKVFWAGTVVVTLEVVAASTIEAGAWLAEIHIRLEVKEGVQL